MPYIVTETYNPSWTAGARSIVSLPGDGWFEFTVGSVVGVVAGLNDSDESLGYLDIDHAFYIEASSCFVIENGEQKTIKQFRSGETVFRIFRIGETVQYYIDGVLFYISEKPSSGTVFLDASMYYYGDEILSASMEEYFGGSATCDSSLPAINSFAHEAADVSLSDTVLPALSSSAKVQDVIGLVAEDLPGLTGRAIVGNVAVSNAVMAGLESNSIVDNELLVPDYTVAVRDLPALFSKSQEADPARAVSQQLSPLFARAADFESKDAAISSAVISGLVSSAAIQSQNYIDIIVPVFDTVTVSEGNSVNAFFQGFVGFLESSASGSKITAEFLGFEGDLFGAAQIDVLFEGFTGAIDAGFPITADISGHLGTFSGELDCAGAIDGMLPEMVGDMAASWPITASIVGDITSFEGSIGLDVPITAKIAASFMQFSGEMTAAADSVASLDGFLPYMTGSLSADVPLAANIEGFLPLFTGKMSTGVAQSVNIDGQFWPFSGSLSVTGPATVWPILRYKERQ